MFLPCSRTRTALLLGILLCAPTGCGGKKKKTAESTPSEGTENPITKDIGHSPAQGDIRRGAERQVDQGALREIAKYYTKFNLDNNRSPANVKELLATMRDAPAQYHQMLNDGWLVMVPGAKLTSDTVILYEKNIYQKNNNRVAAFGDGHVVLMNEPDFQAALKSGGQ